MLSTPSTSIHRLESERECSESHMSWMLCERTREIRCSYESTVTKYRTMADEARQRAEKAEMEAEEAGRKMKVALETLEEERKARSAAVERAREAELKAEREMTVGGSLSTQCLMAINLFRKVSF